MNIDHINQRLISVGLKPRMTEDLDRIMTLRNERGRFLAWLNHIEQSDDEQAKMQIDGFIGQLMDVTNRLHKEGIDRMPRQGEFLF